MSGHLLDTNIILLATAAPERLSGAARSAIEDGPNTISVISFWEVVLKAAKGKLIELGDPQSWWDAARTDLAATVLPVRSRHVAEIWKLAPIHQDLFDRALIAQARVEGLALLTTDAVIRQYTSPGFTVLT